MRYTELVDSELWNLFLAGDKKAFAFIYENQFRKMLAYGLKLSPDREFVKDCIQELFVKIYTNRKNLGTTSKINIYLIKALKNKLYDEFRSRVEIENIDALQFDFFRDNSLEELFTVGDEDLAQGEKLKKAVELLLPHQQEVIYLRFVQDLDYNEIAEILEINYQSSKNLVSRTLAKLRLNYLSL